jgi:metal-responsive CopG/Arc/MetJ family transcriptional regulator
MGRITSNVEDEIIQRVDTLAAAEGLSRSEWVARAVIDRLAVEERGAGVPQEETVPRTVRQLPPANAGGLQRGPLAGHRAAI